MQGYWLLPPDSNHEHVFSQMNGMVFEPEKRTKWTFYDDADFHLYGHNQCLSSVADTFNYYDLKRHLKTPLTNARFAKDFPDPLGSILSSSIGVRKLRPVSIMQTTEQSIVLRDENQKIVIKGRALGCRLGTVILLQPLRGYLKALHKFESQLVGLGFEPQTGYFPTALYQRTVSIPDKPPPVDLFSNQAATDIVKTLLHQSLNIAFAQEHGLLSDIDDPEFIHDYRVALRKCRSLLSLANRVFKTSTRKQLASNLKALVAPTAVIRDLDVFLIASDDWLTGLPDELRPGFQELVSELQKQLTEARKEFQNWLQSDNFRSLKAVVLTLVDALQEKSKHKLSLPCLAKRLYLQQMKTLRQSIARISPESPDDDLHTIRIHGKKLRYIQSFFEPLLKQQIAQCPQSTLKQLQNQLGDFNDGSVQLDFLSQQLRIRCQSPQQGAAIGALMYQLHLQQTKRRIEAINSLQHFAATNRNKSPAPKTRRQGEIK